MNIEILDKQPIHAVHLHAIAILWIYRPIERISKASFHMAMNEGKNLEWLMSVSMQKQDQRLLTRVPPLKQLTSLRMN